METARRGIVRLRGWAAGLVGGVLVCATAASCRVQTEQAPVATEQQAPDFSLPAHDGRTVTLAELSSRGPVVLVFYRGHW